MLLSLDLAPDQWLADAVKAAEVILPGSGQEGSSMTPDHDDPTWTRAAQAGVGRHARVQSAVIERGKVRLADELYFESAHGVSLYYFLFRFNRMDDVRPNLQNVDSGGGKISGATALDQVDAFGQLLMRDGPEPAEVRAGTEIRLGRAP